MQQPPLKNILEAILLAAAKPMTVSQLVALLADRPAEEGEETSADETAAEVEAAESDEGEETASTPIRDAVRQALAELAADYEVRAFELKEVASGFRLQVREGYVPWVSRLWEERPPKYSRALLETLALIAYRQPITRAEIEDIRGVAVSSNIVKTLLEREWVRVVGHKELPGRPAMYATTRQFLDYFNLKSLAELPTLAELRDLEQISAELVEQGVIEAETAEAVSANDSTQDGGGSAESGSGAAAGEEAPPVDEPPLDDESGEVDEGAVAEEVFAPIAETASSETDEVSDETEPDADRPMDEPGGIDPAKEGA
ncbi:hypothetical protein JCM17961_26260 [Endothiovibrio diazotrophicus]